MNNFVRRTLTGAWIVFFMLGGLWLHPVSFFFTGLIIVAGTQYEYFMIIKNLGIKPQVTAGLITGIATYVIATLTAAEIVPTRYFLVLIPMTLIVIIIELYRKEERPFDSLAHTFFSVLYTAIPFSLFPYAAYSHTGLSTILPQQGTVFSPGVVIGFFLLIWANDTGAYLTGIMIGRHRLMERISPKKSWEGFFGGIIIASVTAWLLSGWLGVVDKAHWVVISVIVSVAGTFGDLIESMLKRSAGVKDSGSIMPGHGGFLDRFDSAIISFPLVYLFISLFG